MKKYMVYLEIKEDVFKMTVPAKNEDDALAYVKGNGDVIAIKNVKTPPCGIDGFRMAGFILSVSHYARTGRLKK